MRNRKAANGLVWGLCADSVWVLCAGSVAVPCAGSVAVPCAGSYYDYFGLQPAVYTNSQYLAFLPPGGEGGVYFGYNQKLNLKSKYRSISTLVSWFYIMNGVELCLLL